MNVAPVMQSTLSTFKKSTKLMGNLFEITAVGEDQLNAETQIQGAIDEIKRKTSSSTCTGLRPAAWFI